MKTEAEIINFSAFQSSLKGTRMYKGEVNECARVCTTGPDQCLQHSFMNVCTGHETAHMYSLAIWAASSPGQTFMNDQGQWDWSWGTPTCPSFVLSNALLSKV